MHAPYSYIPQTYAKNNKSLDLQGSCLFTMALLCLLLPLSLAQRYHWLWLLLIAFFPLCYLLFLAQRHKEKIGLQPILPPSILKNSNIVHGLIAIFTVLFSFSGYIFVTALVLQTNLGFSALQSGNTFVATGLLFFIGSLLSKYITKYFNNSITFIIGSGLNIVSVVITIGIFYYYNNLLQPYHLIIPTGIFGLGNSFMVTSGFRITLSSVNKEYSGVVSGILATVQQSSFVIGASVVGAIYVALLSSGYLYAYFISLIFIILWVSLVAAKMIKLYLSPD